jgi:hypothetical protein
MRTTPPTGKRAFACALVMGTIGVLVAPEVAQAHFVLSEPPAWMSQDSLGLPEKTGPCGDEYDDSGIATPTNIVTAYQQGQTITVTINETIFHPGHYRIALATNRGELPADPAVTVGVTVGTDASSPCGNAAIQNPPVFPVLADGVFVHATPFTSPQSIQITLPSDVTCSKCTLQVIEFMGNHTLENPNGCFYHHCADLSLEPAADAGVKAPSDASSAPPAADGGTIVGSDAGSSPSGTSGGTTGSKVAGSSSSSGCSLAAGRPASGLACLAGTFAVAMLAQRRRRLARATHRA